MQAHYANDNGGVMHWSGHMIQQQLQALTSQDLNLYLET